jgi:methionyl-tRNA formyltransferase
MNTIIASNRPFPNRQATNPEELEQIEKTGCIILFPFWSWKVPKEITDRYTCIGFHVGNINGGSPIQNLIRQGTEDTVIRVFKMNDKIDGGDNLAVIQISLLGSLEEIIMRITHKIDDYIQTHYR